MDTIKNAIWGSDQKQQQQDTTPATPSSTINNTGTPSYEREPMNGVAGDTSKGEPYDAGNMTPQAETKTAEDITSTTESQQPTSEETTESRSHARPGGREINPKDFEVDPNNVVVEGAGPRPIEQVARDNGGCMPQHVTPMTRGISIATSASSSSSSSHSDASSHHEAHDGKAHTETGSTTSHEHDHRTSEDDTTGGDMLSKSRASITSSTQNQPMNQDGTHPKTDDYISSGMAADGGNFDVTKPGAGKEAHRLIHQGAIQHKDDDDGKKKKGPHLPIHTGTGKKKDVAGPMNRTGNVSGATEASSQNSSGSEGKGKHGLSTKLKEKLHIGSH